MNANVKNAMIEEIKKVLQYSKEEYVNIHNAVAEEYSCEDICHMDDFNELFTGVEPSVIAAMVAYGDFNPSEDYFSFDGCGNLVSSNYPTEVASLSDRDIAEYIIENQEDFDNDDIADIINF